MAHLALSFVIMVTDTQNYTLCRCRKMSECSIGDVLASFFLLLDALCGRWAKVIKRGTNKASWRRRCVNSGQYSFPRHGWICRRMIWVVLNADGNVQRFFYMQWCFVQVNNCDTTLDCVVLTVKNTVMHYFSGLRVRVWSLYLSFLSECVLVLWSIWLWGELWAIPPKVQKHAFKVTGIFTFYTIVAI